MKIKDYYPKEKDLFPPLKKSFKSKGYTVFAEVPCNYRGVDFVAVNGDDHIAVEMKLSFNDEVVRQAQGNIYTFGKSYVAFPVMKPFLVHTDDFWELSDKIQKRVGWCQKVGIGILQVMRCGTIFEALEAVPKNRYRVFDFSQYQESDDDEAGLPYQKGVSAGYRELLAIEAYVRNKPDASWKEIYTNVQNHYSSHTSLAGSMKQHRGFSLPEFKKSIGYVDKKQELPLPVVVEPEPTISLF